MKSAILLLALSLAACRRPAPAPQQPPAVHAVSAARMDSATIERLCAHPDSVRAGRVECVLKDQSPSQTLRLKPIPPP